MSRYQNFFPDEEVLHEQIHAFWVKGFLNSKMGAMVVTDKRIAFIEKKMVVGGGLVGRLAAEAAGVTKPKLKVDVEFDQIAKYSHPKKMDVLIETKGGETFKIRVNKKDCEKVDVIMAERGLTPS